MEQFFCKSKIHRATVTDANLNYIGSITISEDIMESANIYPYEKVQVLNINNGERFETYAISGERGKGIICINGAAARLVQKGDKVIIISYCMLSEKEILCFKPKVVFLNEENKIIKNLKNKSIKKSNIC